MQHEGQVQLLKSLKLFGMAQAIDELGKQNSPAFNQTLPVLDSLIKAEMQNARSDQSITRCGLPSFLCIGISLALTSARAW